MSVTAVPIAPVKSSYKLWLWLGIVLAALLAVALAWTGTRAVVAAKGTDADYLAWNKGQIGVQTTASGLQYVVLKSGSGPLAKDGDMANLSLEGRFRDGTVFQPRTTAPLPIQPNDPTRPSMMPGFLEAMKLMKKGSSFRIWLPASLGFDALPGVPPEMRGKMVVFDVEMSELMSAAEVEEQRRQQQEAMRQQLEQQGALPPPGEAPALPPGAEGH
ncbi:FKBP-type peptidyl-prolyl cis-trans isomerase [Sphingomonas canadensis]|uniref:Peptidyl-prolyl cis-trans isomerase n=1 Tax=Sphingomonas canadensis TaxID=1219257 RepID=A0ABW3H5M1_9SPHN|nr:FKBP-type peptidyl-prolyl cis-trans isomerase [Sphingomonas canadensis]MCW3835389.1 FKBP-type peptidyl-prolyl cis-trans isomerase [Sphingomonas canadensis]